MRRAHIGKIDPQLLEESQTKLEFVTYVLSLDVVMRVSPLLSLAPVKQSCLLADVGILTSGLPLVTSSRLTPAKHLKKTICDGGSKSLRNAEHFLTKSSFYQNVKVHTFIVYWKVYSQDTLWKICESQQ